MTLDKDINFIFENPSRTFNFLEIQFKIGDNTLVFDICYKPTNFFNYLTYGRSFLSHTKNNIAFSFKKS